MSKMRVFYILIGLLILILAVFLGFIAVKTNIVQKVLSLNQNVSSKTVSPDILFLTNPVTRISGKIGKIEGNTIWVSYQSILQQPGMSLFTAVDQRPAASVSASVIPTPISKTLTYKVTVGQNTVITKQSAPIPYSLKTVTPAKPSQASIKELKAGQNISVDTNTDLRTLLSNNFEAISVEAVSTPIYMSGKIASISGNTINLKAFFTSTQVESPGKPQLPKEEDFVVTVTADTEISSPPETLKQGDSSASSAPKQYSLGDLAEGKLITVYADGEVLTGNSVTALLIQPMNTLPIPPPMIIPKIQDIVPPSDSTTGSASSKTEK